MRKKTELAIVNRGFWPQSLVVGEALLRLAEQVAKHHRVCVITQSDGQLRAKLKAAQRGEGVELRDCRSRSNSSSGLVKRSLDALGFMLWTFWCLMRARPAQVYVSTNPPVVVPFIVFVYCRLFGARYTYHLQDIHPEAANIVVPLNKHLYKLLQHMDAAVMRNAHSLITLSKDMHEVIGRRSATRAPVHLVDNPAFDVELAPSAPRTSKSIKATLSAARPTPSPRSPMTRRAASRRPRSCIAAIGSARTASARSPRPRARKFTSSTTATRCGTSRTTTSAIHGTGRSCGRTTPRSPTRTGSTRSIRSGSPTAR